MRQAVHFLATQTTQQRKFAMQELEQLHDLAELDQVARQLGISRADWSMALAPDSYAFFARILSGRGEDQRYYLKEDLIFEILRHLSQRRPEFALYFVSRPSFPELGYPFGNKLDIPKALASCALLRRRPR